MPARLRSEWKHRGRAWRNSRTIFLSAHYLGFWDNFLKNPPDESWTAAEMMTDK
jgi:hypothetical protein